MREWCMWLITGVEDGWIKVDEKTWRQYLLAKAYLTRQKDYKKM